MTRAVTVYRSRRVADLYLYVDPADGFTRVPEDLMTRFGVPEEAMQLTLTPERRLARADAAVVLKAIDESGFYLQLPPAVERSGRW